MARSAPIPADRAGFRRPITASSASSRRSGASRSTAACRCRSRSTVSDRWRARLGCCAVLDAVLADEPVAALQPRPIKGMRLAVPTTVALDELDDAVARTFERALETLSRQGALIERIAVPEFLDVGVMNTKGGFAAAESYAWHRYLIASHGDVYDPRVSHAHPSRRRHQRRRLYRSAAGAEVADRARRRFGSRPMTRWSCRPPPTRRRGSPISPTTRLLPRRTCCRCAIAR